jgi:hypothetical protein
MITGLSERLSKLSADEATSKTHANDPIAIAGRTYPREDIPEILGGKLDGLPKNVRETTHIPLGTYRGLRCGLVLHSQFPPDVYLEGSTTRQTMLSREHQGPRAVLNALERIASDYGSECVRVRQDLGIYESQLHDYQARLGKSFAHESYLAELTTLRDQLKAILSATGHESTEQRGPDASELAEKIKALKAAHTIEATTQRTGQRQATAEEPVTARIRRKAESSHAPDQNSGKETAAETVVTPVSIQEPAKPMTFRERIMAELLQKTDGPIPT